MARELNEFDALVRRISSVMRVIPSRAATVAVNFTKERFRQQNWLDVSPDPWERRKRKPRETRTDRRHVLIKSGRLMRSIRKITANSDRSIIGTDVEYAAAHNDGLTIQATQNVGSHQVRSYRRRAHERTRNGRVESVSSANVSAHNVRSHRRNVNFKMPQRKFLGTSAVLTGKIETMMQNEINNAIRPR